MARILSSPWSIVRGSIAGTTYLANRFHQIIARARTSPVNPSTPAQATIRSAFSGTETRWKALTAGDRSRWDDYAANTPVQNPLGPITLTGRLFMRAIITLREYLVASLGAVFIATDGAPVTPGMRNIENVQAATPVGPGTGVAIGFTNPLANPDLVAFAQLSPAFEPTRNFWKGPWDIASNQVQPVGPGVSFVISFLGLTLDKAYFMRLRVIDKTGPHKMSQDFIVRGIAETVL